MLRGIWLQQDRYPKFRMRNFGSNDALHLAIMKKENITDIATYDSDFEKVKGIRTWKP